MIRKLLCIVLTLSLITAVGCSTFSKKDTTTTTAPSDVNAVREAQISSQWAMKQIHIDLESEISLVLRLAIGDKVDGYFYLEKGSGVSFQISGNSLIYESKAPSDKSKFVTSDRFAFTASQAQGTAYTLTLATNNETAKDKTSAVVFIELIYPINSSLYVPYGTK